MASTAPPPPALGAPAPPPPALGTSAPAKVPPPAKFFPRSALLAAAAPAPRRPAPKLHLCVPCYGCLMSHTFLRSLLVLQQHCRGRGVSIVVEYVGNESLVQRARNILVAKFLQGDATHLLFIDADIGFAPENVFRLLDFLEREDEDVACGAYSKKNVDWEALQARCAAGSSEPARQRGLDFNINTVPGTHPLRAGFVRVLDGATGFMLITRRACEKMYAAFADTLSCVNDVPGQSSKAVREYVAIFDCMIDPDSRRYLSEDYAFCRRWQSLGGSIYLDLMAPLTHEGGYFWRGDLRARLRDESARAAALSLLDAAPKLDPLDSLDLDPLDPPTDPLDPPTDELDLLPPSCRLSDGTLRRRRPVA